jgi:hypothetical protein
LKEKDHLDEIAADRRRLWEWDGRLWTGFIWPSSGLLQNGKGHAEALKGAEFHDYLSNCYLLEMDFTP